MEVVLDSAFWRSLVTLTVFEIQERQIFSLLAERQSAFLLKLVYFLVGISAAFGLNLCLLCIFVGIATNYGLDHLGVESRWGRNFSHTSRPALGPTQTPVQWAPGISRD
jgi:hypothetical protein